MMPGVPGEQAYQEFKYDGATDTIYDILEDVLTVCEFGIYTLGAHDDGIVDTLMPKFTINAMPYDDATEVIYRLLNMCYLFLRPENDVTGSKLAWFRLIEPAELDYDSTTDTVTYYSDGQNGTYHGFTELEWKDHEVEPNHIYVFSNQAEDGTWDAIVTGEYDGSATEWKNIVDYYLAPELTIEADADNRAAVICHRIAFEGSLGRLVVPHDCSLELYDLVKVEDKRGRADYSEYPPALSKWIDPYRCMVGSLTHHYEAGRYDLEIGLNGISTPTSTDSGAAIASAQAQLQPTPAEAEVMNPTIMLPEPPERRLPLPGKEFPGDMPFIGLQGYAQNVLWKTYKPVGLTYYARGRAQELYEQGFVDKNGNITPTGFAWAKEHPTEEAPRTYTSETDLYSQARYLRAEMVQFQSKYGYAPRVSGAAEMMRGIWEYAPAEVASYQIGELQRQAEALRTREQILADLAAGKRTVTGGSSTFERARNTGSIFDPRNRRKRGKY